MADRVTLVSTTDTQEEVEAALGIKRPKGSAPPKAPEATTETAPVTPVAETPVEPAALPAVVPEPPVAAQPPPTAIPPVAPAAEVKAEPKESHKANVRKREIQDEIDRLTEQKYQTMREYDDAYARVDALRREGAELAARIAATQGAAPGQPAESFQPTKPEPKADDFQDYNEYLKELAKWSGEQTAIRTTKEEIARLQRQGEADARARTQQQAQMEFAQQVGAMIERGRAAHPDFDEVWADAGRAGVRWSPFVQEVVAFHPLGHEIAYQLSQDPQESRRLSTLPTIGLAGVEMGRYIAKVEAQMGAAGTATPQAAAAPVAAPSPMTLVQAPAAVSTETPVVALPERQRFQPVSSVGGGPTTSTVQPDQMTAEQYRIWRNAQIRARMGRAS